MNAPVVRRWEGRAPKAGIDAWLVGYRERVLPLMQGIEGCRGVRVHVGREGDLRTVTVLTCWDDAEALNRFAGPNIGSAVMQDWVTEVIPDCDDFATHYDEVLVEEFQ